MARQKQPIKIVFPEIARTGYARPKAVYIGEMLLHRLSDVAFALRADGCPTITLTLLAVDGFEVQYEPDSDGAVAQASTVTLATRESHSDFVSEIEIPSDEIALPHPALKSQ